MEGKLKKNHKKFSNWNLLSLEWTLVETVCSGLGQKWIEALVKGSFQQNILSLT